MKSPELHLCLSQTGTEAELLVFTSEIKSVPGRNRSSGLPVSDSGLDIGCIKL